MNLLKRAACGAALCAAAAAHAQSTPIGNPYYAYFLYEHFETFDVPRGVFDFHSRRVDSGAQSGGTVFATRTFGHSQLGLPAVGAVAGYDDGRTFWAQAISPLQGGPNQDVVGVESIIHVAQSFRKDTWDATMNFTFSQASLMALNYGTARGDGYGPVAWLTFDAYLVDHSTQLQTWTEYQHTVLHTDFRVLGDKTDNLWKLSVVQDHGPLSSNIAPWTWSCGQCLDPAYGMAEARLNGPYTGAVDLSDLYVGDEFTVVFKINAFAMDYAQGETAAMVYGRDPLSQDGSGLSLAIAGLTPTDRPLLASPVPEPHTWALMLLGLLACGLRRLRMMKLAG